MKPLCPGNAGVAPLRTTITSSAAVLFPPREVVVVVHELDLAPAEDRRPPCARPTRGRRTRTGPRASSAPSSRAPSAHRGRAAPRARARACPTGSPATSARKPDATVWPKPRLPKCTPTQMRVRFVREDVDVVIAAAHRAELRPRLVGSSSRAWLRHGVPGASRTADDRPAHRPRGSCARCRTRSRPGSRRRSRGSRSDAGPACRASVRSVRIAALPQAMSKPTPTTETCSRVGGDAADRHHVAEVAVRHQRGALGAAGDVLELRQRVRLVLAEDSDVRHASFVILFIASTRHRRADDVARLRRHLDARRRRTSLDDLDVRHRVARQRQRAERLPPLQRQQRQQLIGEVTPDRHAGRQIARASSCDRWSATSSARTRARRSP